MSVSRVEDVEGLVRRLDSVKSELREEFDVVGIGVFGSFSRGDFDEDSDVDVFLEFKDGKKTFSNIIGAESFLEEVLGRDVDVETKWSVEKNLPEEDKDKVINV